MIASNNKTFTMLLSWRSFPPETILTDKDNDGKTPLDYATVRGASDEIKALLQPRTINDDPANANDDASNIVPDDDHDNYSTATEIQDQLQADNNQKKIADLACSYVNFLPENRVKCNVLSNYKHALFTF